MKKIFLSLFIVLASIVSIFSQNSPDKSSNDLHFYNDVNRWFGGWDLVSQKIFKIKNSTPVEFVFFDDKYVYSTSNITIPNGEKIRSSKFAGKTLRWKKALHNNSITLPDKQTVPIGLMSFAGEIPNESKAFFVMPLLSFWEKNKVKSDELGLQNLITGVFIHEFAHSQQLENFGKRISKYEKTNSFETEMSDNIVQDVFGQNAPYTELFEKESDTFFTAFKAQEKSAKNSLTLNGLNLLKTRQQQFFKGNYQIFSELDNLFLTMEGIGQFAMYAWLTHPKGGNIPSEKAIIGVRRGGKVWSQEEGFILFLLLDSYEKPEKWAKDLFGTKTVNIIDLLRQYSSAK